LESAKLKEKLLIL